MVAPNMFINARLVSVIKCILCNPNSQSYAYALHGRHCTGHTRCAFASHTLHRVTFVPERLTSRSSGQILAPSLRSVAAVCRSTPPLGAFNICFSSLPPLFFQYSWRLSQTGEVLHTRYLPAA